MLSVLLVIFLEMRQLVFARNAYRKVLIETGTTFYEFCSGLLVMRVVLNYTIHACIGYYLFSLTTNAYKALQ
jgi:hypothetical protein